MNLISNGGFEVDTTGWAVGSGVTIDRSGAQQKVGSYSGLVTPSNGSWGRVYYQFTAAKGVFYKVSAWFKRTETAETINLSLAVASGNVDWTTAVPLAATTDWQRVTFIGLCPSTGDHRVTFLKGDNTGAITYYVDDAQLEEVPHPMRPGPFC